MDTLTLRSPEVRAWRARRRGTGRAAARRPPGRFALMTVDELRTVLHEVAPWWSSGSLGVLALLGVAVVSGLGAFLGQYLGERGKIRAIKDDLDELVRQARVTTKATESIRTALSGQCGSSKSDGDSRRSSIGRCYPRD